MGKAVTGSGNSSVLLPSSLPVRPTGNSYAPSVTSATSQDLDAKIPEPGSVAFADDKPEGLWDRAYTALRKREDLKKLMNAYEKVLLENHPGESASMNTFAGLRASDREKQMSALVEKKVHDMEQTQSKLRLGIKEIKLRPQVDRIVKAVIYAKDFVTSAASADSHAALA